MATQPVLVGVDLSHESAAALATALRLAGQLGQRLVLVHAVGLLEEGGYRAAPDVDELLRSARIAANAGDDVAVEVIREDGPAADVLVRVAERVDAALIVVGRRGLGEAPRSLGSVSERLLARSQVPVVVVPSI